MEIVSHVMKYTQWFTVSCIPKSRKNQGTDNTKNLLNEVNDACSHMAAVIAGNWLLSSSKTIWMLCCIVRQEIFPYSSADNRLVTI